MFSSVVNLKLLCIFQLLSVTRCVCVLQGEIVDRIEEEVAKTVDHVESGNKELTEAREKKNKARKVGDII